REDGLPRLQRPLSVPHLDGILGVEDMEGEGSEPPSFPHFEGEGLGAGAVDQVKWLVEPVEMGYDTQEKAFVSENIRDQVFAYALPSLSHDTRVLA
ncbi:hypothetical protein FRC02_005977, partial [Tulasnella sp. 418]